MKETTQTTDPTQRGRHQEGKWLFQAHKEQVDEETIMQGHFLQIKKYDCCRKPQQRISGIEKEIDTPECPSETSKNLKEKTLVSQIINNHTIDSPLCCIGSK